MLFASTRDWMVLEGVVVVVVEDSTPRCSSFDAFKSVFELAVAPVLIRESLTMPLISSSIASTRGSRKFDDDGCVDDEFDAKIKKNI